MPIIAPAFACAGLGWLWVKHGRPFDLATVTTLVTYIGAPCLIFSSLVRLSVSGEALAEMALAAVLALGVFAVLGGLLLRVLRLPVASYLSPLVFANTGNMGLPLCLFAFGEAGLELAVVFFAVSVVGILVLGVWLVSGEPTPGKALTTPLPYAVAAALGFRAAGIEPPAWLFNITDLLGDMTVPLMLVTLGASLAGMRVTRLGRALGLSVTRLGMGFGVGVALAAALGLDGVARGVFIVECAMPAAVFNYLFAQLYQRAPEETASVILLSTLISFLTLPLLLRFVLVAAPV